MLELAFAMAPPPEGGQASGGGILTLLPPMIIMFVIFYFVLIRPQQKEQQKTRQMRDTLGEGDNVVTTSGIHGTVKKVKEDVITLQIADNVRIKINRTSIGVKKTEAGGKVDDKKKESAEVESTGSKGSKKSGKSKKGK